MIKKSFAPNSHTDDLCLLNIYGYPIICVTFYSILILTHQQQTVFEKTVGKGEIALNKQFLLFP